MVKFGLNGSDATTAAVRLARAYTGRDVVAVCRQNSFFSTYDWFIVTTPMSAGIPAAERLTVSPPFCWAHEKGSVKVGSAPSNEPTAGTAPA
jgi:glutamate-1-semialdehyde 2,1-aminomutase